MQTQLFENENRIRSRIDTLLAIAEKQGYNIQIVGGCAEPGYKDGPVALANWNAKTEWNESYGKYYTIDDTMPRLASLFEKLGYECEWEDEWSICDDCGKAIRTQPHSYSWQPYYWLSEHCEIVCGDCVKGSPEDYLSDISGNPEKCLSFDLDISEYGYILYNGGYESGWHPGQNADPELIAKELRAEGHDDFIFVLDGKGQFDLEFSVWIKQGEEQ